MKKIKSLKFLFIPLIIIAFLLYYYLFIINQGYYSNPIKLEKIANFGNSFGRPIELCVIDTLVLVIDKKPLSEFKYIHVFSINGEFLYSFGDRGSGPNEMISPTKIEIDPFDKNRIWVFDNTLLRFTRFTLFNDNNENKFIKLDKGMPYNPIIISSNLIASLGFGLTSGRFALYDSLGQLLNEVGAIPPGKLKNVPVQVHLVAYQGTMTKNYDASKIIISSLYSDMIELYSSNGVLIKRFYGPDKKLPIYKTIKVGDNPVMEIDDKKSYYGYVSVYATSNKIYALYAGNSIADRNKGGYGNKIHVFDFDGTLSKVYETDEDLFAISVTENDSLLLGIQHYDKIRIVVYKL